MADTKLSALTALTAITGDDGLYVVDDMDGTAVSKSATAAVLRDFTGMKWEATTVTTGNVTATVNTMHGLTISGLTAARDFLLPTAAATGDRVGVFCVTDAPTTAANVLQIKSGAAGDLINGVDHGSGTIWSSLLIKSECLIFRCIDGSTVDWVVEYDGRKFESCRIDTDGTTASHTRNSATKITNELATETSDPHGIWDATNKKFIPRRPGRYLMHGHLQMALMGDGQTCVASVWKNGASIGGGGAAMCPAASSYPEADVVLFYDVTTVGDYFELYVYYSDGSTNRSTNSANIYFETTRIGGAT